VQLPSFLEKSQQGNAGLGIGGKERREISKIQ
jgi:hypothetical protein